MKGNSILVMVLIGFLILFAMTISHKEEMTVSTPGTSINDQYQAHSEGLSFARHWREKR
jgi:hypothetical protein